MTRLGTCIMWGAILVDDDWLDDGVERTGMLLGVIDVLELGMKVQFGDSGGDLVMEEDQIKVRTMGAKFQQFSVIL